MSDRPHQEIVAYDDVRRQGGGIGAWLGIWTFCFSSSLSIGFCIGALVISKLDPSWGFWITIMLLAFFLLVNVIAPETRRSPYRRSIHEYIDKDDPGKVKRRVARGEVKLHLCNDGPKWWYEEVWAGLVLTKRMVFQAGFFVLMLYLAWIQAQLTLVILVRQLLPSSHCEVLLTRVVARCSSLARLPLAASMGRSRSPGDTDWSRIGYATDQSVTIQPLSHCSWPYRQHDYAKASDLDFSPTTADVILAASTSGRVWILHV